MLSGVLIGSGTFPVLRAAVRGNIVERLRSEAELLAAVVGAEKPARERAQAWAVEWARRTGVRVTLVAPDGTVIGDSALTQSALAALENHAGRPEVAAALRDGAGEAERRSSSLDGEYHYFARRVRGVPHVAVVRIALSSAAMEEATTPYAAFMLALMGLTPLLLTALAYAAVRRWSRPLEDLTAGAGRIAAGDLAAPLPTAGEDEIGALGRSLERMRHAIARKIDEAEDERRFLGSVISGMKEGLLLVDAGRRVRLANDAFIRTWGLRSDPTGRALVEVVRHPQVLAAVEDVLGGAPELRERVPDPATGRIFELHASPQTGDGEGRPQAAVVLFFDITRLEALESMRKEFVANVSHELRTPLTSIKASVLTLLEAEGAPPEVAARFLDAIRRNTERMAALVEDLTDLSLIETGAIKLDVRPLDLGVVARDVVAQLASRHARPDVTVDVTVPPGFIVEADRRRLEQVLVNLVENGMKFNRPGGRVTVSAEPGLDGRSIVTVEDTGIGIPSEEIEKIFHRFHRVDPARSQELGGTGLGLAIVKHLVQLHGGAVRVASELGKGSRFVVEI